MKQENEENNGNEQKTEPMVTVELTDESGHVSMVLTKAETLDVVKRNSDHWLFAKGRLIQVAELEKADWSEMAENETRVQLTPGLVGGVMGVNQQRCRSCDTTLTLDSEGYCEICAPYKDGEEFYLENLTTWAREMVELERDILDDVEPLSPPKNDAQWVELIQQITLAEDSSHMSSAHAIDPDRLTEEVGVMWQRVLIGEPFIVDRTASGSEWSRSAPVRLEVIHALAEILLGLRGHEPLWRLKAGIIAHEVNWRNYVHQNWRVPRQRSFRYLRQVADSTPNILPTSEGLMVWGSSGAQYLIGGTRFHEQMTPTVMNHPDGSGGIQQKHVCISAQGSDPFGDRIASLALGLVNDVETAKRIDQLWQIVDRFENSNRQGCYGCVE